MKIPLQLGVAQQAEGAPGLHERPASHLRTLQFINGNFECYKEMIVLERVISFCLLNQKNPNPHINIFQLLIILKRLLDPIALFQSEHVSGIDLLTEAGVNTPLLACYYWTFSE